MAGAQSNLTQLPGKPYSSNLSWVPGWGWAKSRVLGEGVEVCKSSCIYFLTPALDKSNQWVQWTFSWTRQLSHRDTMEPINVPANHWYIHICSFYRLHTILTLLQRVSYYVYIICVWPEVEGMVVELQPRILAGSTFVCQKPLARDHGVSTFVSVTLLNILTSPQENFQSCLWWQRTNICNKTFGCGNQKSYFKPKHDILLTRRLSRRCQTRPHW